MVHGDGHITDVRWQIRGASARGGGCVTLTFSIEDEGKTVVTADGIPVGTVDRVSETMAHVRPDPENGDVVRDRLDWTPPEQQVYELPNSAVETVTADEIRLAPHV